MSTAAELDAIRVDDLRQLGGIKWTMFPGTIGAFVAEMDFGSSPAITAALHKAVDDGLFGYLPGAVATAMADACAHWQSVGYGWEVQAERIHPVPDVLSALQVTISHFTEAGSKVIVPTPAYMPFLAVPTLYDREIIEVPMLMKNGRYEFDLEGIDRAFAAGAGLLVLCNPYNPLGRVFTHEELEAVSEVVSKHGARVFSDEIHSPVVYAPLRHIPYASISDAAASHTITATSASKAWNLQGLKAAQVIITNDADEEIWQRPQVTWASRGTSNLGVIANTAAYEESRDWLKETVEYLDGNRKYLGDLLSEHIPRMGYTAPEGTYIAWLDARGLHIEGSPANFFREYAGVALTDGVTCGAGGAGFMRFVFATPRPIIEQAVLRMANALNSRS